jgi:hypothetical protein
VSFTRTSYHSVAVFLGYKTVNLWALKWYWIYPKPFFNIILGLCPLNGFFYATLFDRVYMIELLSSMYF